MLLLYSTGYPSVPYGIPYPAYRAMYVYVMYDAPFGTLRGIGRSSASKPPSSVRESGAGPAVWGVQCGEPCKRSNLPFFEVFTYILHCLYLLSSLYIIDCNLKSINIISFMTYSFALTKCQGILRIDKMSKKNHLILRWLL